MQTFVGQNKKLERVFRKTSVPSHCQGCDSQRASVRRILRSVEAQTKLRMGAPDDAYEREADRVAEAMMRMPDESLRRLPEDERVGLFRTKETAGHIPTVPPVLASQIGIRQGGPLLQRQEPVPTPSAETGGEGLVSYFPSATVILVGSPTQAGGKLDKWPYNYSDAAVLAVPKLKEALPGTQITILFFSTGFKLRGEENGQNVYKKALADLLTTGATVTEVTSDRDVINFLNTGLVTPADEASSRTVKIRRFLYFGHGGITTLLLNFGWGKESHSISRKEIIGIKPEAFALRGESYFFSCTVAKGEQSFMSVWASHLGQTAVGPQAKTAFQFDARYKVHSLERAANKELPRWFLGMPYMNEVRIIRAPPPLPPPSLTGESPLP